jgi:hypothetical protein
MACSLVGATEEVCALQLPSQVCEDGMEKVEKSLRSVTRSQTVPVCVVWQSTGSADIDGLSTQPSLRDSEHADDDCISCCSFTTNNDSRPEYATAYAYMMPQADFLPMVGAPFVTMGAPSSPSHGSLLTAGSAPLPVQYMMPTAMCNFAGCVVMLQPSQSQPQPPVSQRTPLRVDAKPYICAAERRGSVQLPVTHNAAECVQDRRRCASAQLPVTMNEVEGECSQTALMLRNLPECLMRNALFELLRAEGFAGSIDFLYVPIDLKSRKNYGFAFVNLVTPEVAERFRNQMSGFCDWGVHSGNALEISVRTGYEGSGLDAYIERYRNSRLMHGKINDEYKPALFKNGSRIPFPRPTKNIRLPRSRT